MLDFFALIVLLVLLAAIIAIWVIVGMLPGRDAATAPTCGKFSRSIMDAVH